MTRTLEEIEHEIFRLKPEQKAALALSIIDNLDTEADEDVEQLWLEEAQRRYEAYLSSESRAIPAKEAFAKARARIRR
jgi:hypothetical protein